jgi:hypothetical protein
MQNEPKLGGTGGRRQKRPSYLGHLPGEWNVQNEANCPKRGTEAVSTVGPVAGRAAEEIRLGGDRNMVKWGFGACSEKG